MSKIIADLSEHIGRIKPMHAVNNGPAKPRFDQTRGNFEDFAAAGIPFVRNHDASYCADYGGEHTVDICAIFPDFDADVNDPASYDFVLTDEYTGTILEAGAQVLFRLGNKIEYWKKKYGTLPPRRHSHLSSRAEASFMICCCSITTRMPRLLALRPQTVSLRCSRTL